MESKKHAQAYADFYESLHKDVAKSEYAHFFDENSSFEDPFQKVKGLDLIYAIFENMYTSLHKPHFKIDEIISADGVSYIRWEFCYALSNTSKQDSFVGISRVTFTHDGHVKEHIDYWDVAEHVYEKIPLLGSLLRLLKRKLHVSK
ncbi:MAG: nuclear transport factor 2 family protein [Sulfurospirillum sp.]|nr:nuclear transport factor 2 family protein [Sulfurospirillum sp.]